MFTKHIYFGFLLAISLLIIQCNSDATANQVANEVSTEVANQAQETTKAIQEVAKEAKETTPTLTKAKEAIKETSAKVETKTKEVALKVKEEVAEKKEPVKKASTKKEPVKKKPVKKKKRKKRSKINFGDTTYKFGNIKQGDVIKHDFKFKNTGNAPLVIKKVDVSCGCTFPSYPFIPIEPGKEGTIGITYDSKNKAGRQKPAITVVTNGRPSTVKLYLEGVVE